MSRIMLLACLAVSAVTAFALLDQAQHLALAQLGSSQAFTNLTTQGYIMTGIAFVSGFGVALVDDSY